MLKEVMAPLTDLKGNLSKGFSFEMAEDFEYTKMCYYEALRLEPPVPVSLG